MRQKYNTRLVLAQPDFFKTGTDQKEEKNQLNCYVQVSFKNTATKLFEGHQMAIDLVAKLLLVLQTLMRNSFLS